MDYNRIPGIITEDDTARVRAGDPVESHVAADRTVGRAPTKLAVERALQAAGRPVTADEVYRIARFELGFLCTPQRVRTVLAEHSAGGEFDTVFAHVSGGVSEFGNPARLWTLAGAA